MPSAFRVTISTRRISALVSQRYRPLQHQSRFWISSYATMTSNNTYIFAQANAGTSFGLPPPPPYDPSLDAPIQHAEHLSSQANADPAAQTQAPPQTYAELPSNEPISPLESHELRNQPESTTGGHEAEIVSPIQGPPVIEEPSHPNQPQQVIASPPPPPPRSRSSKFMSATATTLPAPEEFAPPPRRVSRDGNDEEDAAIKYMRDPHKLVAYLVPFPKPRLHKQAQAENPEIPQSNENQDVEVPLRFLIYTPPPPPLVAPKEGEKEGKLHMVQRKWQTEVKEAKTSDAKWHSWKGAKAGATKGINWAMNNVTSHNLDFMNRVPDGKTPQNKDTSDGTPQPPTEKKRGLDEMILIYPSSLPGTQEELRENFVNTMLRTKSKAQRDAIIATGLWPAAFGIDVLLTFVWPFGGLAEVDAAWAWSSMRGAKTARSVTRRLNADAEGADGKGNLKLTFTPSSRLETLRLLLGDECHRRDMHLFPSAGIRPTDSTVLKAIGWAPSQIGAETRNWEDEQWELLEVKDDLQNVMAKASKDWTGWCKAFEKNPKKALKK